MRQLGQIGLADWLLVCRAAPELGVAWSRQVGHITSAMSTLTIRIPDRLKSELSARAKASGKTVPQMVRELLNGELAGHEQPVTASLYDRSRDLCGRLRGGPVDLARNKKHLTGYGTWKR